MYNPAHEKSKIINRRSFMLTGGKLTLLSALGARLYYLQITESHKYKNLSEGNRIKLIPLMPRRGLIKDRFGKNLSEGLPRYQLLYQPPRGIDIKDNFLQIASLINMSKEKIVSFLKKLDDPKTRFPMVVENFLSWDSIARLKVNSRDLKGVDVHFVETRFYPYGPVTGHLTGFTGKVSDFSDENRKQFGRLLKHPDLRVGKAGIELSKQKELLGKPGVVETEVDSKGNYIKQLEYTTETRGNNIKMTIDAELQQFAHQQLKGKGGIAFEGGSAVVLDVNSGDILAMASVPDYDPNKFVRGISNEEYRKIEDNPDRPMLNKAISYIYPPGSTFKPLVALAALEEGVIHPDTYAYCSGSIEFGDREFHCWKEEGHGPVNLVDAIQQSCNVYFYEVAQVLGINKIAEYARLFGLGELTDIPLSLEEEGLVPDPKWKWRALKEPWFEGETLNTSIGQGHLNATPLQLAVMAARLASGRSVSPRLVIENNQYSRKFEFLKGITGRNLQVVQSGMAKVVNSFGGTAFASRIADTEFRHAGKTGTSQTRKIDRTKVRAKSNNDNHSLFIGYAPLLNPKFAISVVVEYGGSGSAMAAPIARDILHFAQKKYLG